MSINCWIDKEDVVCIYNGILLSHKNKNIAICSNMDGPRDSHTKWSQSEKAKYHVCCAYSLSCVWLSVIPWTVAHQAPLSMGILQAGILEWVARPSSRWIFPTQGLNPGLQHCRQILYHLSHQGNPNTMWYHLHVESFKKGYKWTYLQNRNRLTDIEIKLMITKQDEGKG